MKINVEGDFKNNRIIKPEWISVKERLPEIHEGKKYVQVLTYEPTNFEPRISDALFSGRLPFHRDGILYSRVTHWQPLPKAPNHA